MNLDDQQLRHSETPSQLFTADVDVAIIGAGVAGLATAIQAADCGLDVLVIERKEFPRYKVCGGCLNLRSLQILGQIGVASSIWKRGGVTLDRMEWACNGKRVQLKLPGGLAISRLDLDECLAEQAELRGCKILSPATVRSVQPEPQLCTLNVSHDKALTQVRARVVVHAGGLGHFGVDEPKQSDGSATAKRASRSQLVSRTSYLGGGALLNHVPRGYEDGVIYMACGKSGYVGMTVVEAQRFNVATAVSPAFVKRSGGLKDAVRQLLEDAGMPGFELDENGEWLGTPLLSRRARRCAGHRQLVVGDAAGYVEPFTGEGMAWALASAQAVVPAIREGLSDWTDAIEVRWNQFHRRELSRKKWLCRGLTTTLRSPRMTSTMIRVLNRMPWVAQPVIRQLNGRSTSLEGQPT